MLMTLASHMLSMVKSALLPAVDWCNDAWVCCRCWHIHMLCCSCFAQRNAPPAADDDKEDGFNGWGRHLLRLVDEYEVYRSTFVTDMRDIMDPQGGVVGAEKH